MKLVVNTNSNTCRFYHFDHHPTQLTLLKEIQHPENKLKNIDITSDRQGHYKASSDGRGAYSPHMDAKDVEIDNFSREIATELNQERLKNNCEGIIMIALPHMKGLIFQHLNKHVKEMVLNNFEKDLLNLKEEELIDFLQTNAQFRG